MRHHHERYILIGLGAAVALGIVYSRKDKLTQEGNEDFAEGFAAGFLTPGPFTILGLAGLAAVTT